MKNSYFIFLFLVGCSLPVDVEEQNVASTCINKCDTNFTSIIEVGSNKNASSYSNSIHTIYFDEELLEGPSHFTIIAESARPKPEYSYNGEYWVTSKVHSNLTVIVEGLSIDVGQWNSRMDFRNVHNSFYGDNGFPKKDKLATRIVVGPIYRSMAEKNQIITLYMKTDFEYGGVVMDTIRVKIKLNGQN